MNEQLLEIAETAVKKATELGASQVEAYVGSARSFTIDVENNSIKSASEKRDAGCGIRAVVGKKIGFAYVTTIQEDDILEAATNAVSLAKASVADPDFETLASFEKSYPSIDGLFDSSVKDLSSEQAADLIVRAVDSTVASVGDFKAATEAQLSASFGMKAIVNSLGIAGSGQSTSVFMYSYPTVKDGETQTSSFEYQISRKLDDIDPEWIGENAAKNALNNLGAKTVDGGDLPVIFTPLAVGTVLGGGFAGAVNAEEVQNGRSYISDAFGEQIASEKLVITDDALQVGGIGSRAFDAEGYPSQRTEVITSGVLRSLLHNSYTANKDKVDSTGNASRPGYAGIPSISTSNFIVSPGKGTLDNLVEEFGKGIICRNTGDRPNMTTGDLSAMVMEGYYFEGGEIKYPVKSTLIGINMRDLLQRVIRVGEDSRVTSSIVSPSIVIESAKITSG
ncbi:MAG: TldD/PmbA family protein [Candidatus Thorarchaeota archaeon]